MINQHLTKFADYPVAQFDPNEGITKPDHIYRIATQWDDKAGWETKFNEFLANPKARAARGLVVGSWTGSDSFDLSSAFIVELLVKAAPQLPNLHALFLGDIISEENEISWINQSNVGAIFAAYPALTHFGVRGGNGLRFGDLDHANLTTLIVESGGLNHESLLDVLGSTLPNLTYLELYIGTDDYGATVNVEHLAPLLSGQLFPKLRYLGLRDAEIADAVAVAIADAPLLDRLHTLDLSLGTLTNRGGLALLTQLVCASCKSLICTFIIFPQK